MGNICCKPACELRCFGGSRNNNFGSDANVNQPHLASSSQALAGSSSPKLAFTVEQIAELEKIVDYITQTIAKYNLRDESGPKVLPEAPAMVSNNFTRADEVLDRISEALHKKKVTGDLGAEARAVVPDIITAFANTQWVAAGFSMVALVLQRLDQTSENKQNCLEILEVLGNMGRRLLELLQAEFPFADNMLRKAFSLIIVGVVWCDQHMQSGRFKRFTFAMATSAYIEDLKGQIDQFYKDLPAAVGNQTYKEVKSMHRQITGPLDPHKPSYPTNAAGLEPRVSEILQQLRVTGTTIQPGIQAILLHGIGGIGKTTLAKAVCARIQIVNRCFVHVEVGENPKVEWICSLQKDICEILSGEKQKRIASYEEGHKKLQHHLSLCKDSVLLFIDNVFEQDALRNLLPCKLGLPDKSRVVITSRNSRISDILNDGIIACEQYSVQKLGPAHSKALFEQHIGVCPPEREEQADTLLRICNGLPLALQLVGTYLKTTENKNNPRIWESAINDLQNCESFDGLAEDKLNGILRWSYNRLGKRAQQLFLDSSYLLRNGNWDWIESLSTGRPELGCLQDYSLVKKLHRGKMKNLRVDKSDEWQEHAYVIEVHDLLATLGKHISESELTLRTRFSIQSTEAFENFLKDNPQGYPTIEGLAVKLSPGECSSTLPAKMLDVGHKSLRILLLERVKISDMCHDIPRQLQICCIREVDGVPFPCSDTSNLSKLQVLEIQGRTDFDFQNLQLPQDLQILQVNNVRTLSAFHPDAFNKCTTLWWLDLSNCLLLEKLPSTLNNLVALQMLNLQYCHNLKALPDSISYLKKLRSLRMTGCTELKELPNDFGNLIALESLWLDGCTQLQKLPGGLGGLIALKELYVDNCENLKALPDGISSLKNLTKLSMRRCISLEELPNDFGGLIALQSLGLNGCTQLQKLPGGLGGLIALKMLNLEGCENLKALPDGISCLKNLAKLTMTGCISLKELPNDFGDLIALQSLWLDGCTQLQKLPDGISSMKSLTNLSMACCISLEELPNDFGTLIALETLRLDGCTQLQKLPSRLVGLIALKKLYLDECENLKALPDCITSLKNLTGLSMRGCINLEELPNAFGDLTALETLWLDGCTQLQKLPGGLGGLIALKLLFLDRCENLKGLPDGIGSLKNLRTVCMRGCSNIEELPNDFGSLIALESLWLDGCTQLQKLPDGLGCLIALKLLFLDRCENLKVLPEGIGSLRNLRMVCMTGCSNIEELPTDFGGLIALKMLNLHCCENLKVLPDGISSLRELTWLSMTGWTNLEELPNDFGNLIALESLWLDGCTQLQKLPSGLGGLIALKMLNLQGCESLKALPDGISSLKSLTKLYMTGCINLKELPKDFGGLIALESLWLDGCTQLQKLPGGLGGLIGLKQLVLDGCENLELLPDDISSLKNLTRLTMIGCINLEQLSNDFGNLNAP